VHFIALYMYPEPCRLLRNGWSAAVFLCRFVTADAYNSTKVTPFMALQSAHTSFKLCVSNPAFLLLLLLLLHGCLPGEV